MRELVAVSKHLNTFPEDGVVTALHNVFDFDLHDSDAVSVILEVMNRNGIPFLPNSVNSRSLSTAKGAKIELAPEIPFGPKTKIGNISLYEVPGSGDNLVRVNKIEGMKTFDHTGFFQQLKYESVAASLTTHNNSNSPSESRGYLFTEVQQILTLPFTLPMSASLRLASSSSTPLVNLLLTSSASSNVHFSSSFSFSFFFLFLSFL